MTMQFRIQTDTMLGALQMSSHYIAHELSTQTVIGQMLLMKHKIDLTFCFHNKHSLSQAPLTCLMILTIWQLYSLDG